VTGIKELKAALTQLVTGQEVNLLILRNDKEIQVTIQAG
jgi:hypothetical protein